jgi:hypothetical protein
MGCCVRQCRYRASTELGFISESGQQQARRTNKQINKQGRQTVRRRDKPSASQPDTHTVTDRHTHAHTHTHTHNTHIQTNRHTHRERDTHRQAGRQTAQTQVYHVVNATAPLLTHQTLCPSPHVASPCRQSPQQQQEPQPPPPRAPPSLPSRSHHLARPTQMLPI